MRRQSCPKYAATLNATPLMQGSTSPSKYGSPACSQRTCARTRSTAVRTAGSSGSTPRSASCCSTKCVAVHASKKGRSAGAQPGR